MSDMNGGKRTYLLLLLTTICLAALMVAGCGGGGGSSGSSGSGGGGGGGSGPPDINVSELQVLFGGIVLDHFSDRTISIRNTASSLLAIGQIAQKNPLPGPFTIINDNCSGYLLAASRTCTFQVRFEPTTQDPFSDTFDIPSNDPDENPVTVWVEGDGRGLKVSINQIDASDCPTVKLVVSVSDQYDDPQTGLAQIDFSLFEIENGVAIGQAITGFLNQVPSPISVALALDNSGSLSDEALDDLKAAAIAFVQAKDPADEASIIKFATIVELMQAFTDNEVLLENAILSDYLGGTTSTKLYDALWQAIEETADPGRYARRAIVVFTDGGDRGSVRTLTEVIDRADEEGIPIFTVGLGEVITEILQQLADETGGLYFFAPASSDLAQIYDNISQILSNQYAIEYTSTSSNGATTILDVEVDFNTLQGEDSRDFTGCP